MLANLIGRTPHRAPREYARGFVQEVNISRFPVRNRRVERLFLICWGVIAAKCLAVAWAVRHYQVPFSAWWVIGPTVMFAALVTALYWSRD